MNFKYADEASFYKILSSDSEDNLTLPPAFAEKYLEKDNNKRGTVVLKTKSAVEWSVKYFKIKDEYYFMDGWVKFMKDNRLQMGDLLVFSLLSPPPNSIFQVVFYAPNGCVKHQICSSDVPYKEQRSKKGSLESAKSFKSDKPFYSVTMKLSYLGEWGLYVPIRFLKRYLLSNDEMSVNCVLEVSDGRKWGPIKCRDYKTCGKLYGPNWKKFREDNQLGVGDVCVLELMNEMKKVLKVTIFGGC
ncbi:unnamed protein product [Lactuca saligna]|uniref:TF-B3 domain-containing protein n=1 Tax=Lactuca saligna TaxID=75948 RepID=A0AA36DZZ1_LACSI|nr:unnamed protein product [Lactuca saligna]